MRYFKIVSIALSIVTVSALAGLAFEDLSAQRGFGVGMQVTFPMRPPQALPASGMSVRVWLWDRFGIEGDFFVVGSLSELHPAALLEGHQFRDRGSLRGRRGELLHLRASTRSIDALHSGARGCRAGDAPDASDSAQWGDWGLWAWRDAGRG
jgi:hypothetical protein